MDFTHLHTHSVYSTLDGINRIDKLVKRVKELNQTSCALTDHGNLHGVIEFYKTCKKEGINPIIGMESYITEDEDGKDKEHLTKDNYHMVLIAKNDEGLSNLFKLSSLAFQHNFYYRPRINKQNLEKFSAGLIGTSACLGGYPAQMARVDEGNRTFDTSDGKTLAIAKYFHELFNGDYYLELQENKGMWEQKAWNDWIIKNAKPNRLKTTISADAHYLTQKDSATHALIMAMQLGKTLKEYNEGSQMKYGDGFFIRSTEEMLQAAQNVGCEEAFYATTEISKQCKVNIELGKTQMPMFDITKEEDYPDFLKWKAGCGHQH
jgi:DNA polymerase III subunit alpha